MEKNQDHTIIRRFAGFAEFAGIQESAKRKKKNTRMGFDLEKW